MEICPWDGMTSPDGESLACRGECKCQSPRAAYQYKMHEASKVKYPKRWLKTGEPR